VVVLEHRQAIAAARDNCNHAENVSQGEQPNSSALNAF
jgi:hypothetical protein